MTTIEDQGSGREQLLTDPAEMLLRQVHPNWVEDGVPSSQAFVPTKKDEGKLSIARGSTTSSEAAFKHYTTVQQMESAGTWGVTVGEALEAGVNSFDEPWDNVPAHGFVDFRGRTRRQAERNGKLLVARARVRGRLYPAPDEIPSASSNPTVR